MGYNGIVQILVKAGADANLANPEVSGVMIYPMKYAHFDSTCILSLFQLLVSPSACWSVCVLLLLLPLYIIHPPKDYCVTIATMTP